MGAGPLATVRPERPVGVRPGGDCIRPVTGHWRGSVAERPLPDLMAGWKQHTTDDSTDRLTRAAVTGGHRIVAAIFDAQASRPSAHEAAVGHT